MNRYNVITGNTFNHFVSDDPNACPILLGGGDASTSIQNTITSNHFAIEGNHTDPPALDGDDGICGDPIKVDKNITDNNFSH